MEFLVKSIEKMIEIPLEDAGGFFFCVLAGVIVNWIWKCKKEGIKLSSYWLDDLKGTVLVFAGAIAVFITTIIIEPGVGKATYFAIGIAADSMIGRPPLPIDVRVALSKIQDAQNEMVNSGGIAVPSGVFTPDPAASAVEHAIEKVGQNYVAGVTTRKADAAVDSSQRS